MKEKQISEILIILGILIALIGATLMWFGIAPVAFRITILIIGMSLIAFSSPILKLKNI
jgi:hypothetical protein